MNNAQRDDLLLSLAKGLNNLQESLNEFRKEVNNKFDYFEKKYDNKIDSVEQKLNDKIDSVEQKLNDKIDSVNSDLSEKIDNLTKDHEDFKNETKDTFKELIGINRDVFNSVYFETKNRLDQHDIEIDELKKKLA